MQVITIKGIRCSLVSNNKLQLEIPQYMSGHQLERWQLKYRSQAIKLLKGDK